MDDTELARQCRTAAVGLNPDHLLIGEPSWPAIRDAQDALTAAAERLSIMAALDDYTAERCCLSADDTVDI